MQQRAVGVVLGRGRSLAEQPLVAEQSTCTTSATSFVQESVEE